jgi:type II secretory pathway component GspD/PulD (secretin)
MPKLSLRDLFWTVTLAAVLVAWWMDHSRLQKRLQAQTYPVKIFSLVNAKADELAGVVRAMYAGDRDYLVIASDARTNSLIVSGPEAKLAVVEAILLRLDQPGVNPSGSSDQPSPAE